MSDPAMIRRELGMPDGGRVDAAPQQATRDNQAEGERGAGAPREMGARVPALGRMLEVEVAANTVYAWAADEMRARRLAEARPGDATDYAAAVHHEAQALRYRAHERLMRGFLEDEV